MPEKPGYAFRQDFKSEQFAAMLAANEWRLHAPSALLTCLPPCYTTAHGPPRSQRQSPRRRDLDRRQRSMATAKFVVGIAIGSLALISEALHSLGRSGRHRHHLAGGAGFRPSRRRRTSLRPRQVREPVGARRHRDALRAGRRHRGAGLEPSARRRAPPTLSAIPFVVLLVDIVVNFWRARALHRTARDTKSQALAADALHFASDVLGSIAVIIGLALSGAGLCVGRRRRRDRRRGR